MRRSTEKILEKIASELERALAHGAPGCTVPRVLAAGVGWTVSDVLCTCGPRDRRFEEQHSQMLIAIVAAGTFQYRSDAGRALMTPGSLMLGIDGHSFECGHDYGAGDRCIAFHYTPEFFEALGIPAFQVQYLPPQRALSACIARACGGVLGSHSVSWEDVAAQLALTVVALVPPRHESPDPTPGAISGVARVVRMIEQKADAVLDLKQLARAARLSPFHFLRTFESLTGVTPHQYLLRVRLRQAALRLQTAQPGTKILDIALDSGFGDISNFNRSFRAEFRMSPREWLRRSITP